MIRARTALHWTMMAIGVLAIAVVLKGFPGLATALATILRGLLSPLGIVLLVVFSVSRIWRHRMRPTAPQEPQSRTDDVHTHPL